MKRKLISVTALLLTTALLYTTNSFAADAYEGTVTVGVGTLNLDNDSAEYGEYNGITEDELFFVGDAEIAYKKDGYYMDLTIEDIGHEPVGKMDIIYCQNLLIYFDRERREEIAGNLVGHLHPGGLLILGSGELTGWKHPLMEKVGCNHTLAYKRRKE